MRIIAFGHKKRVGKDTATKFALAFARQYYPHLKCQRLSFGDEIKKISLQMFGWAGLKDSVYYDNHEKEREVVLPAIGLTPRQIWDDVGSHMAELCPKIWPELALQGIDADVLFCSDLRRPMEIEYVRMFNGSAFRIDRDAAPKSNHIVDTSLDAYGGWDEIIQNNGDLREFNRIIKFTVANILNKECSQGQLVCPSCFDRGNVVEKDDGILCGHCSYPFEKLT